MGRSLQVSHIYLRGKNMSRKPIVSVDTSRMLCHVALLAAWEGDSAAAEHIFAALQSAKPNTPEIRICRAMVCACQDRFSDATVLLNEVLAAVPHHIGAKSLLGFVKFSMGERGWQKLLEEVVADGTDAAAVELASQVLQTNREYHTPSAEAGSLAAPSIIYD
jgi:predicted Zn-dependent protease